MATHALNTPLVAEHPAVQRMRVRAKLERVINKLINVLDQIDGDPDLEDGADDEPSLGSVGGHVSDWGRTDDLEFACEDEGAEHDGREPEYGL